jgi:uncharacterized protein YaiI (UPF0178 family)
MENFTIWVDADACPKVIKEILFRVAERRSIPVILVANQYLQIPPSPFIKMMQVEAGFDVADQKIVELCQKDDLVITADIPLAYGATQKGAVALNPRGELYTADNIGPVLRMRDLMESLRSGLSEISGGPASFSAKNRENFANQLDKFLSRAC